MIHRLIAFFRNFRKSHNEILNNNATEGIDETSYLLKGNNGKRLLKSLEQYQKNLSK